MKINLNKKVMMREVIWTLIIVFVVILLIGFWFWGSYETKRQNITEQARVVTEETKIAEEVKDKSYIGERIVYYGALYRFSTSGTMGFYYYDIKNDKVVDKPYYWFWAYSDSGIDEFVDFISKNEGAVFKITGTREEPDDYYAECKDCGNPDPLETIKIEKVEIYKK